MTTQTNDIGDKSGMFSSHIKSALPFSLNYGDRPIRDLLPEWQHQDDGCGNVTWREPATGFSVAFECTDFENGQIVEWVVRLTNTGKVDTPTIEQLLALDMELEIGPRWLPVLSWSPGCAPEADYHTIAATSLPLGGDDAHLSCSGGGKDITHLPFFRLDLTPTCGMIGAMGWPGRWVMDFSRGQQHIQCTCRGPSIRTRLLPGESIRTPRILLLRWEGDPTDAHNLLRRHILTHHTPHMDGKPVQLPLSCGTWGGMKTANHLRTIATIRKQDLPYDGYWMDAGWFGSPHETEEWQDFTTEDWFFNVGDWQVNTAVHPGGLKPISEAARAAGMRYHLWFDPERAVDTSLLAREHRDWFFPLSTPATLCGRTVNVLCFNFGNPEARVYLTERISSLIDANHIGVYRHDCNFNPAPYWDDADAPDRKGMSEIRYVEGLLTYWDELLKRHPGLVMDLVQRKDLETIRRGTDLTRGDYPVYLDATPEGEQAATMGGMHWLPGVGTCVQTRGSDTYQCRSGLNAGLSFPLFQGAGSGSGMISPAPNHPWNWHRDRMREFLRARPFFRGDFYPLTPCSAGQDNWLAYQLHCPEQNAGIIVAYRRPSCPHATLFVRLRGLTTSADYLVEDADGGAARTLGGTSLMVQLTLLLPEPRSSLLWFYTATPQS